MKQYIKDGVIKTRKKIVIKKNGLQYINPSEAMVLDDGWVEYVAPEPTEEDLRLQEIDGLKLELESTDYMVIKCMEAVMTGEEMPYDVSELHAERQALRDRINELENM